MAQPVVPASIQRLIDAFAALPGIGPKSAARLTFYFLRGHTDVALQLAEALTGLIEQTHFCSQCFNVTDTDPCAICANPQRDASTICVVEEPMDVLALERIGHYRGVYHVLHGALSPLDRVFAENLRIAELEARLKRGGVREVILATNPTAEGDYTAAYLLTRLKPYGVRITRLGRGLPVGGDLEYADEVTLLRALEARQDL